ncbi:hypothetical protein [Aquimarina algicola]|uniref:DUF4959 domain-containing protein n=1 Tax=Aquimarina algicola TaxID=2589995 RepID=A0A504JEU7_9FLAO|nr:hypothetical protein [Aquimarina algicola]TPN85379.1 hypothetical protein FHK87_15295 [Aquimarina algicola]
MKTSIQIKYILLFYASIGLLLSCSNDDDATNPIVDPDQEIVLATFDYSNLNVNSLPNMIFANNAEGELLASIETNKIPGVYTLTAKGYASNSFMLTTLLETDRYKSLSTIKNVSVGSEGTATDRSFTSNGTLKVTLSLTSDIQMNSFFINGLRGISESTNDIDPSTGTITRTFAYNKEASASKLFLKIEYRTSTTPTTFAYKWLENYKETDDVIVTLDDFTMASSTPITVDDEADFSSVRVLGVYENNYKVNLRGSFSERLQITTGFDEYIVSYDGEYPNSNHSKTSRSSTVPDNISITRPDWDFNYTSTSENLQLQPSGDYLFSNIYTEIKIEDGKDLEWFITIPNNEDKTFIVPQLPESLSGFENYFEDTSKFDSHSVDLIDLANGSDYEDYIKNLIDRTDGIFDQSNEIFSIYFNR